MFSNKLFNSLFIYPQFAVVALVISLFLGIFGQLQMIAQLTILQTHTETNQLGHVFSVQSVLVMGAFGVATFLFGWVAETYGITSAFYLSAIVMFGIGIICDNAEENINIRKLINMQKHLRYFLLKCFFIKFFSQ